MTLRSGNSYTMSTSWTTSPTFSTSTVTSTVPITSPISVGGGIPFPSSPAQPVLPPPPPLVPYSTIATTSSFNPATIPTSVPVSFVSTTEMASSYPWRTLLAPLGSGYVFTNVSSPSFLGSSFVPVTLQQPASIPQETSPTVALSSLTTALPPAPISERMPSHQSVPDVVPKQTKSLYDSLRSHVAIAKFDGTSRSPAETWIALYEQLTEGLTDVERISLLISYFEGNALVWYGKFVSTQRLLLTWIGFRELFDNRFVRPITKPIVEASKRTLQAKETIQTYFDEKTRLLTLANVPESAMIDLLTDGLPFHYRGVLCANDPTTLSDWLRVAQSFESVKRNEPRSSTVATVSTDANNGSNAKKGWKPRTNNSKDDDDKPSKACPRCLEHGKTEWHWARKCPSYPPRKPKNNSNKSTSNTTPKTTATENLNSQGGSHN